MGMGMEMGAIKKHLYKNNTHIKSNLTHAKIYTPSVCICGCVGMHFMYEPYHLYYVGKFNLHKWSKCANHNITIQTNEI